VFLDETQAAYVSENTTWFNMQCK